jgi:hypothetical protein
MNGRGSNGCAPRLPKFRRAVAKHRAILHFQDEAATRMTAEMASSLAGIGPKELQLAERYFLTDWLRELVFVHKQELADELRGFVNVKPKPDLEKVCRHAIVTLARHIMLKQQATDMDAYFSATIQGALPPWVSHMDRWRDEAIEPMELAARIQVCDVGYSHD